MLRSLVLSSWFWVGLAWPAGIASAASAASAAPVVPAAPAACAGGNCIQVGSFNIKYLGGEEDRRTEAGIRSLADFIGKELDLEVIVLQEINTQSAQWSWLKKHLASQGYDFFEGATSERNQFVVIAWDTDEVALEAGSQQALNLASAYQDPADPACAYKGLRVPIAARLKAGKFDFWIVGVHLKSRSHVAGASLTCAAWIREQQAAQLARAVGDLIARSKDEDVLIAGDFNERHDHDSLRPLRMAGFQSQMIRRQEGSGSCSFLPACLDDDLIDSVWVQLWQTRELVRGSGFVYVPPDAAAFEKNISDHVPVWASFRTD